LIKGMSQSQTIQTLVLDFGDRCVIIKLTPNYDNDVIINITVG